jgi:2-polyprenyl-3-methyl-5-hydroxy-6-metoxy-1,4-benzoquinol methylase
MDFKNNTNYTREEDLKRLKFIQEEILKLQNPNAKVLDVGCGNGNNSRQIASLGFEVLGIDISKTTIDEANRLNEYQNLSFEKIAAEDLAISNKFDAIICSEVVEHLHKPTPVIKTLINLLEKDGVLIVTVPNGFGPREVIMTKPMQAAMRNKVAWSMVSGTKKMLGFRGSTIQSEAEDLRHVQFFTKASLIGLLKNQGLVLQSFRVTNFIESVLPFSILTNRIQVFQKFDNWLADQLPHSFSSGFMTTWKHKN